MDKAQVWSRAGRSRAGRSRAGRGSRSCDGGLANGGPQEGQGTIARRCLTTGQSRKGRYDGKCARADTIAVRGTANGEESSRQLILGSGFKTADLIRESNVGSSW